MSALWFLAGLWVGAIAGFFICSLCVVNARNGPEMGEGD